MTDLPTLVRAFDPGVTSLLLGAGASMPSGAPSWTALCQQVKDALIPDVEVSGDLPMIGEVIEAKRGRRDLIEFIRTAVDVSPVGGLSRLPNAGWRAVYTTNYDRTYEKACEALGLPYAVVRSVYDLPSLDNVNAVPVWKLHGCISQDRAYGQPSSMVITRSDYRQVRKWKENLLQRMQVALEAGRLLVVGHSLTDPHLDELAEDLLDLQFKIGLHGRVGIVLANAAEAEIEVYERRGFVVARGDIDAFMAEVFTVWGQGVATTRSSTQEPFHTLSDGLAAITIDVTEAISVPTSARKMFSGSPASYYDINHGRTFPRELAEEARRRMANKGLAVVVGGAGMGKTTLARQVLLLRREDGLVAWEHRSDLPLDVSSWLSVNERLVKSGQYGCLLLDNAHAYLRPINELLRRLDRCQAVHLELLVVGHSRRWRAFMKHPRLNYPSPLRAGRLSPTEIEGLMFLAESQSELRDILPVPYLTMSRKGRKNFLEERCRADPFICLKNLFSTRSFDSIILEEYEELPESLQDVYRLVAGIEAVAGGCHRQMVLRYLGIEVEDIAQLLDDMEGLLAERLDNDVEGVYVWRTRHAEVAEILCDHFFPHSDARLGLIEDLLEHSNPSVRIEANAIRGICNKERGLGSIHSGQARLELIEKMVRLVPQDHVVRHRLIRELLHMGELPEAEQALERAITEVGLDPPLQRYRIDLLRDKAREVKADPVGYLMQAWDECLVGIRRYADNWHSYRLMCLVACDLYEATSDSKYLSEALRVSREAYSRLREPELEVHIANVERRLNAD